MRGKHKRKKGKPNKKTWGMNLILILGMLMLLVAFVWHQKEDDQVTNKDKKIEAEKLEIEKDISPKQENVKEQEDKQQEVKNKQEQNQSTQESSSKLPKQYQGYQVAALLEIPEIDLTTYILQNYSAQALNKSVTKFWGADANQIGNFCVAGHNFQNNHMFKNIKKLNKKDSLFITDPIVGKVKYEIYDIYKVDPSDVSCLNQKTNGKREVTLITCTNDSKKRIIVKAAEVK